MTTIVSKISYDKKTETLTYEMGRHSEPYVVTAEKVTNAPTFCESDHAKVIYQLFYDLHNRIKMSATVSAKFKDAYMVASIASKENGTDMMADENFSIFLNAIDAGSKSLTKGEYVVAIQHRGAEVFHKSATGMTANKASAKVFKTLEHAKWEAIQRRGNVVTV